MTYEEFQRAKNSGQIRYMPPDIYSGMYDPSAPGTWMQMVDNGMGEMTLQAMPGFTPPQAPAPLQFDNRGAGFNTPLTSGGQQVYGTTMLGPDGNWANAGEFHYLQGDPSMPKDAAPVMAGGHSTDNGGGGFKDLFSEGLPFLALAAGGAVAAPAVSATALGGAGAGATLGAGSAGGLAAAGGGNLADVLRAGATGGTVGAVTGGIGDYLSAPTVANSGMDFGGQGVGWSPDTITGATPTLSGAESLPVSQPTTLQELLQQAPQPYTGGGLKVSSELPTGGLENVISGSNMAGGATGITPGTTAAGLGMEGAGAGLTVPGVTGTGTSGLIGTAGIGLGAGAGLGTLAAAGSSAPALGGGGALSGGASAAAAGAGGIGATKLSDLANGNVGLSDLAGNITLGDASKALGTGAITAASLYGQNEIANKYDALARDYMAFGAPSRGRYEASYAPGFDITTADPAVQSAMNTSYQSLLRGLSTTGNPYGNPGGLAEAQKYVMGNIALPALNQYRNQNAATGGFGAFSTAAPGAAGNSINATGNMYADLGRGASALLNPPTPFEDMLKKMKGSGFSYSLT